MKHTITSLIFIFMAAFSLVSCLDDSNTEITTYDDTAITSATFGTEVRIVKTKTKAGKDTTYQASYSGTTYPIYIDHYKRTIYNTDSLLKGTKMDKLLVTFTAKNSGIVTLKSLTSDSIQFISSSDSLDFSKPRKIIVYSNSGRFNRTYDVNFVVHKEDADVFTWNKIAVCEAFKTADDIKTAVLGNKIYALAKSATNATLYISNTSDGKEWNECTSITELSANATMAASKSAIYILDQEKLYTSADGSTWSDRDAAGLSAFVGACGNELFAISNTKKIVMSLDNGATWAEDACDESVDFVPSQCIASAAKTTKVNSDIARIVMVGNRDRNIYTQDSTAMVWSKIVEEDHTKDMPWAHHAMEVQNYYKLRNMDNLAITPYHEGIIAIGGKSYGMGAVDAYKNMYYSIDNGLSWHKDSRFALPENFSATAAALATDSENYLWIIAAGSGEIWKGRLSQLGWTNR